MKKSIYIILLGMISLVSCDKLFLDVDGIDAKIQGKWQQTDQDSVYYNFQNNLFQYQKYINKDAILSVYGYYTLLGDTGIYLELLPSQSNIKMSLDFLKWDTIHGATGIDTLVQQFSLKIPDGKKLNLSNESKNYLFHKF